MKALLFAILAIVLATSARGEIPEKTVGLLLRKIRAGLPAGWTASYDKENDWLEVVRAAKVPACSVLPNGPPEEKPEPHEYAFAFRVRPFVSDAEYDRLSGENAKILNEAAVLSKDLAARGIRQRFDRFMPRNDENRVAVAQYEALKKTRHQMPDFHFLDISLQVGFDSAWLISVDDKLIAEECERVREQVERLLSRYEPARDDQ